jgi:hypothetical protein
MVSVKRVSADVMDAPKTRKTVTKELTPAQRERQAQQRQFTRMIAQMDDHLVVFEVGLTKSEKPITIRQRLLRAAQDANKEIAVRRSPSGFLVGLMTPGRRSNRGRKKASAS